MKKNGKIIAALLVLLPLIFAGCQTAYDYESDYLEESLSESSASRSISNTVTYTTSPEICNLVYEGYNEGVYGPIIVTQGTMIKNSTSYSVYLITLSGTEFVENQSTGYITDLLSGFNLDNAYYRNVISVITNNIPTGSNLVLAGHSLGGMICQQVAANSTVKANYNVLNTVTFGSPLLSAGSREGTVKRLGDTSDVIPYASGSLINNTIWAILGLNRENGGYGLDLEAAHTESYLRSDVWGKYDITGTKNGSTYITLNLDTKTFYQSPTTVTE